MATKGAPKWLTGSGQLSLNKFFDPCTPSIRIVDNRKKKTETMLFLLASRAPECQPTGTPHARANTIVLTICGLQLGLGRGAMQSDQVVILILAPSIITLQHRVKVHILLILSNFCPALTKLALDLHVNRCMSVLCVVFCLVFFSRSLIGF